MAELPATASPIALLLGAGRAPDFPAAALAADLFTPPERRLSEQLRLTMLQLLDRLLAELLTALRREMGDRVGARGPEMGPLLARIASLDPQHLRPALLQSGLLPREGLAEALKARAVEHAIGAARPLSHEAEAEAPLDMLVAGGTVAASRAAVAYMVTESVRLDRFREPLLACTELSPPLRAALTWAVAAWIRHAVVDTTPEYAEFIDECAADSALHLLAAVPPRSVYDHADELLDEIAAAGTLSPTFLIAVLRARHVSLFVCGLARLARTLPHAVQALLGEFDRARLAILAAAARFTSGEFATLLALLEPEGVGRERAQALFDRLEPDRCRRALSVWRADPAYRNALLALERGWRGEVHVSGG